MIQLTKEEIDAIEAEAKKLFPIDFSENACGGYNSRNYKLMEGWIAGATSRAIEAKSYRESLEKIEDITLDCYTEVEVAEIRMICQQVNYKP